MIDPWLSAALFLVLLCAFALIRVIRIPVLYDRLVAATVAITFCAGAGLVISIGLGNILILDIVIVIVLLSYAAVIAFGIRREVPA